MTRTRDALRHIAFDLRVAAVTLRLLADIDHRQAQAIGEQRGKGNACGFAAGDAIELLETGLAQHDAGSEIHDGRTDAREG